MTAFFTWLGSWVFGWGYLGIVGLALLGVWLYWKAATLIARFVGGPDAAPEAEPIVLEYRCLHPNLTQNQGGAVCIDCGERVA